MLNILRFFRSALLLTERDDIRQCRDHQNTPKDGGERDSDSTSEKNQSRMNDAYGYGSGCGCDDVEGSRWKVDRASFCILIMADSM